jgi:hypothetical protein
MLCLGSTVLAPRARGMPTPRVQLNVDSGGISRPDLLVSSVVCLSVVPVSSIAPRQYLSSSASCQCSACPTFSTSPAGSNPPPPPPLLSLSLSPPLSIYVYVHIHIHVYVYVYVHAHMYVYVCVHVYVYVYVYICICNIPDLASRQHLSQCLHMQRGLLQEWSLLHCLPTTINIPGKNSQKSQYTVMLPSNFPRALIFQNS